MDFIRKDYSDILIVIIFLVTSIIVGGLFIISLMKNLLKNKLNYVSSISKNKVYTKALFYFFGVILLAISYLGPIGNFGLGSDVSKIANVIFLLDTSKSMDAMDANSDGSISRLELSKKIINNFVNSNPQNNYSLVIFAGKIQNISPLTNDIEWFLNNLNSVNSDSIKNGGTNIQEALKEALNNMLSKEGRNILILSDGEDLGTNTDFNFIKDTKGIYKIFSIGIGSVKGGYIPTGSDLFGSTIYKTFDGEKVITKLNEDSLTNIAKLGNGKYIHGETENVVNYLNKDFVLSSNIASEQSKQESDIGYSVAIFSFLLFIIGYLYPNKIDGRSHGSASGLM